jgi:hypothetical protein
MPVRILRGLASYSTDRRSVYDRRLGERRQRPPPSGSQRRREDRRARAARRETAAEHIRNALQLLQEPAVAAGTAEDRRHILGAATLRLRLAAGELERLESGFRQLGGVLRRAGLPAPE